MKKDYILARQDKASDQTEFIRQYWEKVWQNEGGPKRDNIDIAGRDEYRVIKPFIHHMPPGAKMLDAGCGLGEWTIYFAGNGFDVLGLDLASDTIAKLQQLFPEIPFTVGDIRATGLQPQSFDCIYSWGVFEHFEDGMQSCINEAYRLLKPGGLLFVSVPHDNLRHGLRALRYRDDQLSAAKEYSFYQWRFTRQELATELARGGFEVATVERICKQQGVLRCLYHEFGLHHNWLLTKGLSYILQPFFPAWLVSHMILGVARKGKA